MPFQILKRCELSTSKSSADSHIKVGYLEFYICVSAYFSYAYSFTIDCIYLFNIIGLLVVMDRDRVLDSTSGSSFQRRGCAAVSSQ